MITICYAFVNSLLEEVKAADMLQMLPEMIRLKVSRYASPADRALRIAGMYLLMEQLATHHSEHKATLEQLVYDERGKPAFPDLPVCFSISHSGNLAVCAFTDDNMQTGIDVEKIYPVQINDVTDYLSFNEQQFIAQQQHPASIFYDLWTRKEAVLKASGAGIGKSFSSVEVLENPVVLKSQSWYWQKVSVDPEYCTHLASALPISNLQIREVIF